MGVEKLVEETPLGGTTKSNFKGAAQGYAIIVPLPHPKKKGRKGVKMHSGTHNKKGRVLGGE